MLIDQIAASLPTENIIADTLARRRELKSIFYEQRKMTEQEPPKSEYKPKPIQRAVTDAPDFIGPVHPHDRDFLFVGSQRVLPDWAKVKNHVPRLKAILKECAEKHGVSINEMISSRRFKNIVAARMEFYYRAKTETSASLPEIGRSCGGKDHTTVLHGVRKYKAMLEGGAV